MKTGWDCVIYTEQGATPACVVRGLVGVLIDDRGRIYVDGERQSTRPDGRGYECTTIDGKTYKVHRLVASAWHGPANGRHVDHINKDKTDNRPGNLRYRDPSENSADCRKTSRRGMKMLSDVERDMLEKLILLGYKTKPLAGLFGVGLTTIRRHKRHVIEQVKSAGEVCFPVNQETQGRFVQMFFNTHETEGVTRLGFQFSDKEGEQMPRRNKHGIVKHVDSPLCCECKSPMDDIDTDLYSELAPGDMSGAVRDVFCHHCGHHQNICPSIEWQTWDA